MGDEREDNSERNNPEQGGPGSGEQNREMPRVYWSATRDRAQQMELQLRSGAYEALDGAMLSLVVQDASPHPSMQAVPCVWPEAEAGVHIERLAATYPAAWGAEPQGKVPEIEWSAGVDMQSPDDSTMRLDLLFGDQDDISLWFRAGKFMNLLGGAANLKRLVVLAYPPAGQPLVENQAIPDDIPLLVLRMPEDAADSLIDMLRAIRPDA